MTTAAFVGSVSDSGFQLTPVVWGQTSFLPCLIGRWQESNSGTIVNVTLVPNTVFQCSLVVVFAYLGTLVHDPRLLRVAAITIGCTILGWIGLQLCHWTGAKTAERKLISLMGATASIPVESLSGPGRRSSAASTSGVIAVLVAGVILWRLIYDGVLSITTRPSVDLVYVYWTAHAIAVSWLLWASPFQPRSRVRLLWLAILLEVAWTVCVVVDGYTGDGRPILAWRWSQTLATNFPVAGNAAQRSSGAVNLVSAGPGDFPAFRGLRRDGVVTGTRIHSDWAKFPPSILWQHPVGAGWSAFAAVGEFAITQEQRGEYEAVVCYELKTGDLRWEHRDQARFQEMMGGEGPRATPTIHEGHVYTLGATGILNCLDSRDGHTIWSANIATENSAPKSLFGMAGSPLVWRDLVVVAPGGPQASLVAYDRHSGRRVWHYGDAEAGYASPLAATFAGVEQILIFNAEGLFSHAPSDGRILWSVPWVTPPERNNVCQPVVWIDRQHHETVFISSGYGKGCGLFDVDFNESRFIVKPRWTNNRLQAKFTSVVQHNGFVYGLDNNTLCCLELSTGRRCWKAGRYGFGQVLLVENRLLVITEDGEIVLCDANPFAHRELARFPVLNGRTWSHPALIGDQLLIRNDRQAACVRLPTSTNSTND